jgi:molybdenum cofactor cytidylyltransferase
MHLGEASLVQRSNAPHTGFDRRNIMTPKPTVILFSPPASDGAEHGASTAAVLPQWSNLALTLQALANTGLHVVLAADTGTLQHAALHARLSNVTVLAKHGGWRSIAEIVSTAALASSQADGWLILPLGLTMLRHQTLLEVAQAIHTHPIAYPLFKARKGHPLGVGRELFSELIRLEHDRDLDRLTNRYPSVEVEVEDPGVIMQAQPLVPMPPQADTPAKSRHASWRLPR